jgi:hypothetical protein
VHACLPADAERDADIAERRFVLARAVLVEHVDERADVGADRDRLLQRY